MDHTTPQTSTTLDAGVHTRTLNRPGKLNACTAQMGRELAAAFLEKRAPSFPGKVSTDMPPQSPWWPQA